MCSFGKLVLLGNVLSHFQTSAALSAFACVEVCAGRMPHSRALVSLFVIGTLLGRLSKRGYTGDCKIEQ